MMISNILLSVGFLIKTLSFCFIQLEVDYQDKYQEIICTARHHLCDTQFTFYNFMHLKF